MADGSTGTGYTYTGGKGGHAIKAMIDHDFTPFLIGQDVRYFFGDRQQLAVIPIPHGVVDHVDFHEQGVDNPYYFAPAAEPLHEVITPFQRSFQRTIGKNHAKYFDKEGWFYFTKERFDLFYPSYGDTYPMYNGGIGMTYEQGGSGRAGLAVINSNGDTLSLKDRINGHFTTGMSTVEVAAATPSPAWPEWRPATAPGIPAAASSASRWSRPPASRS